MSPFDIIKNHSRFLDYIAITIVLFGVFSFFNMRREARPNVDMYTVYVSLFYPGASPSDMEELVIDPIEEKIIEIDGIEEFQSVSSFSRGNIMIKIDSEFPKPQEVIDEIRREVPQVKELPEKLEAPIITEIKTKNIPVIDIALYGDLPADEMHHEVQKLKDFLRLLPGVQSVTSAGSSDLQFKILTQPEKLDENDITLMELIQKFKRMDKKKTRRIGKKQKKIC